MAEEINRPVWSSDKKTLTNVLLKDSNLLGSYNVVTTWYDGTPMTDAKLDSDLVYVKYENSYLVQNFEYGQVLQKDTMAGMRALTSKELLLLKMGVYKHIQLNGYYTKSDTPLPIEYNLSTNTSTVDDGGSLIIVQGVKLEHLFEGEVDVRYYGATSDTNTANILLTILNKFGKVSGDPSVEYLVNTQISVTYSGEITFNIRTKTTTSLNLSSGSVITINGASSVTGNISTDLNNVHNYFLLIIDTKYVNLSINAINGKEVTNATTNRNYFLYCQNVDEAIVRDSYFESMIPVENGVVADTQGSARAIVYKDCASGEIRNSKFKGIQGFEDGDAIHIQTTQEVGTNKWAKSSIDIYNNEFTNTFKRAIKIQASGCSIYNNRIFSSTTGATALTSTFSAVSNYGSDVKIFNNYVDFKVASNIFEMNTDSVLTGVEVYGNFGILNSAGDTTNVRYSHVQVANTEGLVIRDNVFKSHNGGVYITGGLARPNTDFKIFNNILDGASVFSNTDSLQKGEIRGNVFKSYGTSTTTLPYYSIDTYQTEDLIIDGNTFTNSISPIRIRGAITKSLNVLYNKYTSAQSGMVKVNTTGASGINLLKQFDSDSVDMSNVVRLNNGGVYNTSATVDYNNILTNEYGLYSASAINAPTDSTQTTGYWFVITQQVYSGGDKIQFAYPFRKYGMPYIRVYNNSNTTWSSWNNFVPNTATTSIKGIMRQSTAVAKPNLPLPTSDTASVATDVAGVVLDLNDLIAKYNTLLTATSDVINKFTAKLSSDESSGQQAT